MKTLKSVAFLAAALVVAFIGLGASASSDSRPGGIPSSRWVKLSSKSGLVLSADAPSSGAVAAQLYIEQDKVWRRVTLDTGTADFVTAAK